MRLLLATALLSSSALAQVDPVLRFPVLNRTADQTITGGAYYDTLVGCPRWYTGTAYSGCAQDSAAVASAIGAATANLATTTALNNAIAGEVTARNAAISTATTGLATAASVTAEASARASADTALNAAIAALQANTQLTCVSASLTGLAIPLTGGLSSVQSVAVPNAPVGTACFVGGANRVPAGARPDVVVTTAGTASVAFVGGGGLLSSIIAIPSGTYRICCAL